MRWLLGPRTHKTSVAAEQSASAPAVLILTPLKNASMYFDDYVDLLKTLTYPHQSISLGFLESDSHDDTHVRVERWLPALRREFRRAGFWRKDFGYLSPPRRIRGLPNWQVSRRIVLAKSRNHLLFHALEDEEWVLWLDVDVIAYPPDLIQRLLATGKEIVHTNCVLELGGPTWDINGWRDQGRLHLDDLAHEGELVELDAVGGTVLLVKADIHRDGLIFPPYLYGLESPRIRAHRGEGEAADRGEIETEGLGIMARDMGHTPWGLPHLQVVHRDD
jgi:peptide chain release factor subunit 1